MKQTKLFTLAIMTLLILSLTLLVAAFSYAGDTLSLEQAIETAIRNNQGLKAADSQVQAADAGVLKSASAFLPKVTVSETWSKTDNPMMVLGGKLNQEIAAPSDFEPSVLNSPEPLSNYNTRLSIMQPLFNGGKEYIGRSQAKLAKEAAVLDRERTRQETVYNVIKAYYGLLLAKAHYSVAVQSIEASAANVKLAEARYKAGAVLHSDLLRAKVQYAEVKEMLSRSENNMKTAAAGLSFSMGIPQSTEFEVAETLEPHEIKTDLSSVLSEASARRPDLMAMAMNRKNVEKSVSQARTDYLPTLNLMGQADWNSERIAGDDGKSWALMAVFQWNLFDGLATRSRVKEAAAASSRIKAMEEQTRSAVQLQARQAYYALSASLDRIAATASSVQEAEEGLRIVQKRYETGMTNLVDVLGAENALIRARTNALQALYDNNVASAELKLSTGTL